MIDRRTLLRSSAAAGVLTLAAPRLLRAAGDWDATVARAKEQGEVVIYSSGVAKTEEPRMAEISSTTGVRVRYSRPGGGEIVIRKFEQEAAAGSPIADVCTLTDYALGLYAKKNGWCADLSDLPNVSKLAPAFALKDPEILPIGGFGLIIVVNETMLPEGQGPKSYKDLIDPKWKDQILLGAPENAGSTTLMIKGWIEQYGWDFVKKLRENEAAEMRLQAEAMQAVARGEKPICVVAQAWGYLYQKQGAPVRLVFPEDGTVIAQTCLFVAKEGPHPEAGRFLANELLSADYQSSLQATGSYPSNAEAPLAEGIPPLDTIPLYWPNLEELQSGRGELLDQWRRIMG